MKKKISILVAAISFYFGTVAIAQSTLTFGKSQIVITAEEGSKNVILDIDKVGNEKINLNIKNENDELLKNIAFDEVGISKKRLIFNDLPAQKLTFDFEGSINEYSQIVDLQSNTINIDEKNLETTYKPTLTKRGNRVFVQWIFRKPTTVEISVTDNKNEIFHKEKTKTEETYSRSFNIAQLPDGEYFIALSNDKKAYHLHFIKSGINIESIVALK